MKNTRQRQDIQIIPMDVLYAELVRIRKVLVNSEKKFTKSLSQCHPKYQSNLYNLIHYIALRQIDLRQIQHSLAHWGLSSLGRSEGHVLANINQVIGRIGENLVLKGMLTTKSLSPFQRSEERKGERNWFESQEVLHAHSMALLGSKLQSRHSYIIVTAPGLDEMTSEWCERLLKAGMNCLRINCAHGTQSDWEEMITVLRSASRKLKIPCKVMLDLAGPKIRTGVLEQKSEIQVWKPTKDELGYVAKPMRIECVSESQFESQQSQKQMKKEKLFIPKKILRTINPGDCLRFRDARNKKREIQIVSVDHDSCLGDLSASVYLHVGIKMTVWRNGKKSARFQLKRIIPKEPAFTIRKNDLFYLVNSMGRLRRKSVLPEVPCTLGKVLSDLRKGERVFFDDGKVLAIVEQEGRNRVLLRVIQSQKDVFKLKADKGINLPDSNLHVSGLTAEDKKQLKFVLTHADVVSLSFIKTPEDIRKLINLISKQRRADLGLVLKIETVAAFTHLPEILIEAMKHYPVGVMIARGDLAVECGFERMAELQEEILWLCEAAGLPSIWATQVLESLAHSGVPSRAEISDAAMSVRAEAVMLNKGPYIHEAVKTLDNILQRMEKHQHKKRHLYRSLKVAFTSDFN